MSEFHYVYTHTRAHAHTHTQRLVLNVHWTVLQLKMSSGMFISTLKMKT